MKKLRLKIPIYVIDCDLNLIVLEITTSASRPKKGLDQASKLADQYAIKTSHSVCVVKPVSWH